MDRLTETSKYPLDTFKRCQLCGRADDDIVHFRMWYECDDQDQPENCVLVICRDGKCVEALKQHPRLYKQIEWGFGQPGHFMLVCSDCKHRSGPECTHPNLKANGGSGLEVIFSSGLPNAIICFHDEDAGSHCKRLLPPANECAGKEPQSGRKDTC